MRPRALLLDFNGTVSDDEPLMCGIFQELFAERGRALSEREYFDELAGLSDPEIVRAWLGEDAVAEVVAEKIERYRSRAADGSTVHPHVREAVRAAAARVPVAIVSGAARAEVEPILRAAGLESLVSAIVTADDVERGKPDPEGYLRALELLEVAASDAVAFEDTEAGVSAAIAAGLRCVAVIGTAPRERLARATVIADCLDAALLERTVDGGVV